MDSNQQALLERITLVPGLLGGKPSIRGLRFLVSDVLELLSTGMTEDKIVAEHPVLEKEDIHASLLYASLKTSNTKDVFQIPEYMKEGIRQGMEDIKNGNYYTLADFEKKYDKYLKD